MRTLLCLVALSLTGCAYSAKSPDGRSYDLIVCAIAKCDIHRPALKPKKERDPAWVDIRPEEEEK